MSMRQVIPAGRPGAEPIAFINRQHPGADSYDAAQPWLLLYVSGRVERYPSFKEVRDEALKSWPGCRITRS